MTKSKFLLNAIAFVLAWLALPFLLMFSDGACPPGSIEIEGVCAADLKPEQPTQADGVQPSDEKPPLDKMPSYEREGIHAETPPSMAAQDVKMDAEKAQANAQGKKAAGIK